MSDQTKEGNHDKNNRGRFEQEFQALPLDEKFAILFKMEVAALSEALSLAVNDPMKVLDKVGSKLNEFGERIEAEFRRATSSSNATGSTSADGGEANATSGKKGSRKQSAPPSAGADHV
jgi:hypothetical protein